MCEETECDSQAVYPVSSKATRMPNSMTSLFHRGCHVPLCTDFYLKLTCQGDVRVGGERQSMPRDHKDAELQQAQPAGTCLLASDLSTHSGEVSGT